MVNGLLHYLQDSVEADSIELEDRGSKALHKVPNKLGAPHPDMKKTGDTCFLLTEHMYSMTNFSNRQRNEVTVFGDKRWNHDKVGPARLERKTLHSRASL